MKKNQQVTKCKGPFPLTRVYDLFIYSLVLEFSILVSMQFFDYQAYVISPQVMFVMLDHLVLWTGISCGFPFGLQVHFIYFVVGLR